MGDDDDMNHIETQRQNVASVGWTIYTGQRAEKGSHDMYTSLEVMRIVLPVADTL